MQLAVGRGWNGEKAREARMPTWLMDTLTGLSAMAPGVSGRKMPPTHPPSYGSLSVQGITVPDPLRLPLIGHIVRWEFARNFCDDSMDLDRLRPTALGTIGERKL